MTGWSWTGRVVFMAESSGEGVPYARGQGTRFKKGQVGNPLGGKAGGERSALLKAMRWVMDHRPETDRTEGQKACRKFKEEDPSGFIKALASMERTESLKVAKVEGKKVVEEAAVGLDEGSERVLGLLAREWEAIRGVVLSGGGGGEPAVPGVVGGEGDGEQASS